MAIHMPHGILVTARHRKDDGRLYFQSVHISGGGGRGPRSWSQIWGGVPVSDFFGGVPSLRFWGGGYPVSVKGKMFDTRFGLIHVQTRKIFLLRDPPSPPVKGKIFDTRFGLIHVQTGKKIFCQGTPPPQ